jgi:DNA-binding NtrC family response regulator
MMIEPQRSTSQAESTRTVLVVDDVPALCRALTRELSDAFTVLCANSGAAAMLVLADRAELCAVICDFDLGDGPNGGDVLKMARSLFPHCARVLVSGSSHESIDELVATGGAHVRTLKPIEPGSLLRVVLDLLAVGTRH